MSSYERTAMVATAPRITRQEMAQAQEIIGRLSGAYERRVVGQARLRESLLVGLLTGGHVLLESVPGLAKTTAAETLAHAVSGSFARIQCTPDLLPSDIIGSEIYDTAHGAFTTRLGPVHANFVLLDEINRSSAKTQSAMLEAMQERQTTIGGVLHPLPRPFLVMATQNPIEQEGTYVLAEAQLDRFMIKDLLDYPSPIEEAEVLDRIDRGVFDHFEEPVSSLGELERLQTLVRRVYLDRTITEYIVGLAYVTRHVDGYLPADRARLIEGGVSPRASIALSAGARALALLRGRDHVIPEDVRALAPRVLRHRLLLGFEAEATGVSADDLVAEIIAAVRTP